MGPVQWSGWIAIGLSAAAAVGEFIIGSLDRDGHFKGRYDGPWPLLLSPYFLLAIAGWWNRARPRRGLVCLLTAVIVAAIGLGVHTADYVQWRATPPNQQGQSWGRLLAFLVQMVICVGLFVGLGVAGWVLTRRLTNARPVTAADPESP